MGQLANAKQGMGIAVLIINYKTAALTGDCLRSLAAERAGEPTLRVVLVDNASADGSVEALSRLIAEQGWQDWVTLLPQPENLGFAGGNNVAIRHALGLRPKPALLLLLNSDTIVHPGCLGHCRQRLEQEQRIGVLSCNVRNGDGTVQNVCRKLPRPLIETLRALGLPYSLPRLFGWADLEDMTWDRDRLARPVEWVGGAFLFTRSEIVEQLGGLDESFFFYGEDIEFCHRVRRAGHLVFYEPLGRITHFGGASSDPSRLADRRRNVLRWRARFLVQRKCYGRLAQWWVAGLTLTAYCWKRWWLSRRLGQTHPHSLDIAATVAEISDAMIAIREVR